jgi:hypothetical protein
MGCSCHRLSLAAGSACAQEWWSAPTDIGGVAISSSPSAVAGPSWWDGVPWWSAPTDLGWLSYRQSEPRGPKVYSIAAEQPSLDQLAAGPTRRSVLERACRPCKRGSYRRAPTAVEEPGQGDFNASLQRHHIVVGPTVRRRQTCGQNEELSHQLSRDAGS